MAASWFHASVKTIGRSAGRSACAAAAYRAGRVIHDERTGITHDYTRKGGIESSAVLLPDHAPAAFADPARLWNAAEASEKRKNSMVARELELALPADITAAQRQEVAEAVARFLVERYGVAAHVSIHQPHREGDQRNHHAHILFTTRRLDRDGFGEKTRELDDRKDRGPREIEAIREAAAERINTMLERTGSAERVDHRSFDRQGVDKEPTQHLGPAAGEMERRGEATDIGDKNRAADESNREREELQAQANVIDLAMERERRRLALIEQQRRAAVGPDLDDTHKAQRQALYDEKERRIAAARAASRDEARRFWRSMLQTQERERRDLQQAQGAALSRLGVWLQDRKAGRLDAPDRGLLSGGFRALIGKDAAQERLEQRHEAQRAELRRNVRDKARPMLAEINATYRAELSRLRQAQRQEIRQRQERERATGTDGPTYSRETEGQAEERRSAFIAEIEQERERLRVNDRERTPEPEQEPEQATATEGPPIDTTTAPDPEHETEAQAEERRRAFLAEIYQERARLRENDRERGPER